MSFHIPYGQLIESTRFNMGICFCSSVEDKITKEFGLENIVAIEDVGTERTKSRSADCLACSSRVHKY